MTRDEFLLKFWKRYPPQSAPVFDVADFRRAPDAAIPVAGRLEATSQGWRLSSSGASIAVSFTNNAVWDQECLRNSVARPAFDASVLRAGDLMIVGFSDVGDTSAISGYPVSRVKLVFAIDDPNWRQPSKQTFQFRFSHETGVLWQRYLSLVHDFFRTRGFCEVQTPTLVPSPGTEPFLDPFSTRVAYGGQERIQFLPTSPEFHLKKMLVGGWTRIFELKTCFRNNEAGSHHQPEFTMLEWYRAFSDLDAIARDTAELIAFVAAGLAQPGRPDRGASVHLQRISIAELFARQLGFSLRAETTLEELRALARREQIPFDEEEGWDDVYFRIFLSRVEPALNEGGPWLVYDYPPSQAALARINERGWADRFEVYWKGLEIANAFHELNDPEANRERFAQDLAGKIAAGKEQVPVDEELVNALYAGLPPSGGIALGIDRLFMAVLGLETIEETRPFPYRII